MAGNREERTRVSDHSICKSERNPSLVLADRSIGGVDVLVTSSKVEEVFFFFFIVNQGFCSDLGTWRSIILKDCDTICDFVNCRWKNL